MIYKFDVVIRSLENGEERLIHVVDDGKPNGKPAAWRRCIDVYTHLINCELVSVNYRGGEPSDYEKRFCNI